MAARIALMSVSQPFVGPWWRAKHGDTIVRITGLSKGETLILESDDLQTEFMTAGSFPIPIVPGERYRFMKCVADNACPSSTTVEVLSF